MERESFLFYKSFYEALKGLSNEIKLEVLTAIIEYGLYGRQPENLKPFASSIFTLVQPNIDANNTRYENGKKGGRKPTARKKSEYTLSYEQEVEKMEADSDWQKTVCDDFSISKEEYGTRLQAFLRHCNDSRRKPHDSLDDAKSHFRYWIGKAFPKTEPAKTESQPLPPPPDYNFNGGFGGMDI